MTNSSQLPIIHVIVAARPNFVKAAPLMKHLQAARWCDAKLIHAGQHYDDNLSGSFFRDLEMREPALHLGVGGQTHAEQTSRIMLAYEQECLKERPDWTVVIGDVNATLACALAAKKLNISVAHLEAGLRSGDRTMPEEINRLLTDAMSDLLWTPSEDADENLLREGVAQNRIELVGNIMLDSLADRLPQIRARNTPANLGLTAGRYGVVTLHRPSNVDCPQALALFVDKLIEISEKIPLVMPVHPRTGDRLMKFWLWDRLASSTVRLTEPFGYIDFMSLMADSAFVITDSGGVQEETTYLGIPCLTTRSTTERPITVSHGTNRLVSAENLATEVGRLSSDNGMKKLAPKFWDGKTAGRVAESLLKHYRHSSSQHGSA